ncbi:hypothetical protein [Microvirga sp. BSC39]|uniref:hypothetical protein n=1 Tax=Microvirga sp. BSC39 TaxID=1549810 RepID=UPI001FCB2813|nr:hypothetical protein [Microvirga sp. BSC39]
MLGPIWTPPASSIFRVGKVKQFGAITPVRRPGQPREVAPSYLFLAFEDSLSITGCSCTRTAEIPPGLKTRRAARKSRPILWIAADDISVCGAHAPEPEFAPASSERRAA